MPNKALKAGSQLFYMFPNLLFYMLPNLQGLRQKQLDQTLLKDSDPDLPHQSTIS